MYRSGWTGAHNPHWRPLESHEQHMRAKTHHHELQHVVLYFFFFPTRKLAMLSSGINRICHSNPTPARSPCIASHGRLLTSQHCHRLIFLLAFGLLVPVAWNNFKDHTATSRGSSGSPPTIDLTKHTRYQRHIKLNAIIAGLLVISAVRSFHVVQIFHFIEFFIAKICHCILCSCLTNF